MYVFLRIWSYHATICFSHGSRMAITARGSKDVWFDETGRKNSAGARMDDVAVELKPVTSIQPQSTDSSGTRLLHQYGSPSSCSAFNLAPLTSASC